MHWTEAEELAALVLGLDPDEADSSEVEDKMADKFGVDMETFQKVAEALMPFTVAARTALGNTLCRGYAHEGAFICRQEVPA